MCVQVQHKIVCYLQKDKVTWERKQPNANKKRGRKAERGGAILKNVKHTKPWELLNYSAASVLKPSRKKLKSTGGDMHVT